MGSERNEVYGCKLRARSKLRLLLTETEAEKLDDSAAQSGASRPLLISEALRAGLANPPQTLSRDKRSVRVDVWVPSELAAGVRRLAVTHHLPQQHLLRLFLFQYLTTAPWELPQNETEKK